MPTSLLLSLCRCCQAGKDVANQLLDTPGMLAALKAVLDAPPPPLGAGGAGAEAAAGAGCRLCWWRSFVNCIDDGAALHAHNRQ